MINIDDRILSEVDENQLFLLCAIAKHMGKNAKAWPSNKTLCETTRWSLNKLIRVKKSAIAAGLLTAEIRFLQNAQTSNVYEVKTRRISVMVNMADLEPPTQNSTPPPTQNRYAPPTQNGYPAPPQNGVTEVLTNEVLTNEQLQQTQKSLAEEVEAENEYYFFKEKEVLKGFIPATAEPIETPPPPPNARRYERFDIDTAASAMMTDFRVEEKFARDLRYTLAEAKDKLPILLNEFVEDQKAIGFDYNKDSDFRRHFFSWILVAPKAKAAARQSSTNPPRQSYQTNTTQSVLPKAVQKYVGK